MRRPLILTLFVVACGGPSQQQLAETPSASARARPVEAPPASTSDRDRERAVQQFDDMETTQNAYREANQSNRQTKARANAAKKGAPATTQPAPTQPVKKGPAEQAPPGATP